MRALLVQQGVAEALKGPAALPTNLSEKEKASIMDKAHSAIILSLGDKALQEVSKDKSAQAMWLKLELLYMTKSLANTLYMKQRLYSFKMSEEKSTSEQIDDFNKIIDDLENIHITLEDEDKALLLLNAIPKKYEHFKDVMLYGRDQTITLEEVQSAVKAKELQRKLEGKEEGNGENLTAGGRTEKRDNKINKNKSRSKSAKGGGVSNSTKGPLKCFHCCKEGYFKRDCPDKNKKHHEKSKDSGDVVVVYDGYDSADALAVGEDSELEKEWILDSGCSFHMCPNKRWFESFETIDGGSVLFGNNKAHKVIGIGFV